VESRASDRGRRIGGGLLPLELGLSEGQDRLDHRQFDPQVQGRFAQISANQLGWAPRGSRK
jgi:hypothetical protein